jgi:RNA polymerase primary sigma factor
MVSMGDGDKTIRVYLQEIGQVPLLTPEQEVVLAERIHKGDEEARKTMILANLRLVVKIAQDYARYGLPLLDLISEGNIGLMKAVERFDPKKGGKLSTYAAWWIKQAIKRALANQSKTIRLPAHLVDKISRMRRVERELQERLGRAPTDAEIAEELGVDEATVSHWHLVALQPRSLDSPITEDDSATFGEIIGDESAVTPDEALSDTQLLKELELLIRYLPRREREILKYRYGLGGVQPETLEEVGRRFGITRERVRQLQLEAEAKLRDLLEEKIPRPNDLPEGEPIPLTQTDEPLEAAGVPAAEGGSPNGPPSPASPTTAKAKSRKRKRACAKKVGPRTQSTKTGRRTDGSKSARAAPRKRQAGRK